MKTLRFRMILLCVLLVTLPFVALAIYSIRTSSQEIERLAFAQLESLRNVKKHAVQDMVARWTLDATTLGSSPKAVGALAGLASHAKEAGVRPAERLDIDNGAYKTLLRDADAAFSGYVKTLGYYDVFLIDEDGRVLYTHALEPDIGEDLGRGPLRDSGLAKAWREAMVSGTAFIDFAPYAPSNGAPAAFIAVRLSEGGRSVGVAALQIPLERLNALLQERSGMGATGETYLVGADKLMRSDSFLDPQNHGVAASFRNPAKGTVDTEASRAALSLQAGCAIITDYNGNPVLSSYAPIKVGKTTWAIIAEIDVAEAFAPIRAMTSSIIVVGLGIIVLAVGATLVFLRKFLLRPMESIQRYADCVAGGDYSSVCHGEFSTELGSLRASIQSMVGTISEKMGEAEQKGREASEQAERAQEAMVQARSQEEKVKDLLEAMRNAVRNSLGIADRLSSASQEISAQVEEISQGAAVQSSRVEETATAMEQMHASVAEVARNVSDAAVFSGHAMQGAEDGARVVHQTLDAIVSARDITGRLDVDMRELGEKAAAIGAVMNVISDIADQTNLLALNAAIEAARAGDAGRGFAVVADEVRKLAEKTMGATKEVGDSIRSIQLATQRTVGGVNDAVETMGKAGQLAEESGRALGHIVDYVGRNTTQVQGIASAAEEQSATSEQIATAISEIRTIIGQTAESLHQSSQAVHELASMATELSRVMNDLDTRQG